MMVAKARTNLVTIDVTERATAWRRALPKVRQLCRTAAAAALDRVGDAVAGAELSIVLADDALITDLNRLYRGIAKPTNVLSFSSSAVCRVAAQPRLLGDVVLAYGTIAREASMEGKSLADHLTHLVVHGVLHLLGFDHERATNARRMERLEVAILGGLGVPDPYRLGKVADG